MGKHSLSKSTYIKGLQCHKFLFLYKNHYALRDKLSAQKLSTFRRGTNVGVLAQQLFPNGINLTPKSHFQYDLAIEKTKKCIDDNEPVLYEPAFKFNDVLIFLDILVKEANGWHAYEVKSSRSISETYINDAALQYFVLKGAGLNITDFTLIHVNEHYIFNEKLDINKFFSYKSVLNEVVERQEFVENNINQQKRVLSQSNIPDVNIGLHCYKPYDCEFIGYCWQNILKNNTVFDVEFLSIEEKFSLFQNGINELEQLVLSDALSEVEKLHLECLLNKSEHIDKEALELFFSSAKKPVCFLDILSFKPAVPFAEGHQPYQNFIFLLSALYEENGSEEHIYCLCKPDATSKDVLSQFLSDIAAKFQTIIAYDKVNIINILSDSCACKLTDLDVAKIFGIKEILEKGFYVSYKLKGTVEIDEVLIRLGLKNYFADKTKINNVFESSDSYLQLISTENSELKEELKQKLVLYSKDNLRYLSRLYSFIKKKSGFGESPYNC